MTDPLQDPPRKQGPPGWTGRVLRAMGRLTAAVAGHLLMYVLIGLAIGVGLWLFGGLALPQALVVGLGIVLLLILIGAAGA